MANSSSSRIFTLSEFVSYQLDDGVATFTLCNGKVNAISHDVIAGLNAALDRAYRTLDLRYGYQHENLRASAAEALAALREAVPHGEHGPRILASGHADLICLSRALLADPHFPAKARCARRIRRGRTTTASTRCTSP